MTSYTELYGYTESVSARYGFYTDFYPYICRYGFLPKIYGFSKYTEFLGYGFFLQIRIFTKIIRIFEIYGFFSRYGFFLQIRIFTKIIRIFKIYGFFSRYGFFLHIRILYGFRQNYTDLYGFFIRIFFENYTDYTDFFSF